MRLVIDANILFSAIIKSGTTKDIIITGNHELYSPNFLIEEYNKYASLISKKTNLTNDQVNIVLRLLLKRIKIVKEEKYKEQIKITKIISPDKKDVPYLALALSLNCPVWSNDKKLKEQNKIKIVSTSELMEST